MGEEIFVPNLKPVFSSLDVEAEKNRVNHDRNKYNLVEICISYNPNNTWRKSRFELNFRGTILAFSWKFYTYIPKN